MQEALRGLVILESYRLLKLVAEAIAHTYAGPTLPNGSPEAKERFYNAAVMRRGYELLWTEVERQAKEAKRQPSYVQQMLRATLIEPMTAETEVETRRL